MKIHNMMKKIIAGVLIVLLSFNSFAAIVSDNDGSAFVTKAEFESLKKDFADQIDNYNTSIDSKKYLYSYYVGGVGACYSGGWWTSKDSVQTCIQTYPFGNGAEITATWD